MDKKDYLLESPLVYISSGPYAEIQVLTKIRYTRILITLFSII